MLDEDNESVHSDDYEPFAKKVRYMDMYKDDMDIEVIDEIIDDDEEEEEEDEDTLEMFDSIVNDIQVKPSAQGTESNLTLSASLTFAIEKIEDFEGNKVEIEDDKDYEVLK